MAFDNATFPFVPLKHDRRVTVIDPVSVVTNGNYEYRVKRQQWERFEFTLSAQTMTNEQKENIRQFLMQRDNSFRTFKYVDPEYSTWEDVVLPYSGTWGHHYMYLPFGASTPGTTHPLFNQDAADFTVKLGGTPTTFTFEKLNGIPTVYSFGANGIDPLTISGTISYNVRLNSSFQDVLFALDCNDAALGHQVPSISLMEVHGES